MRRPARRRTSRVLARAVLSQTRVELLEPRQLLSGSIAGTVWNDANGDGARGTGEAALSGWTVYLDQNRSGARDAGEASTTSATDGSYAFPTLAAGTYYVGAQVPAGWEQTWPGPGGATTSAARVSALSTAAVVPVTTTGSNVPVRVQGDAIAPGGGGFVPADAESNPLIKLDQFRGDARYTGVDGRGYSVAVLDTGIDLNHPFFGPDADGNGVADRIVYQYDFADGDADASDVNGHGSNVTGIAAGGDAANGGVAPGADIVALKVFGDSGAGLFSYIESALQWVVANAAAYNIAAVNMSLSDSQNWSAAASMYGLGDELAALAAKNVIVVSAAGNEYYGFQAQGVAYPAADPNSLAVAAVWDGNNGPAYWGGGAIDHATAADRVVSFSQRSTSLVDTFAPGAFITGPDSAGGLTSYGGTSQASPHVAGAAVLAQQLAVQQLGRRLTLAEFRDLLKTTGAGVYDGDDEDDNVANTNAGYKRLDVKALADAIHAMSQSLPFGHRVVLGDGRAVTAAHFGARPIPNRTPAAPDLDPSSDTGASAADNVTRANGWALPLSFTVSNTIKGATVRLYADGAQVGSADATGTSTAVPFTGAALADGARTLTARQWFATLGESPDSPPLVVTVDTAAPPAPARMDLRAASDSGLSASDDLTNDFTPAFDFSAAPYYQVLRDGQLVSSSQYVAGSSWGSPPLADGTYAFSARAVDAAGNVSLPSLALSVTIDTTATPAQASPVDTTFGAGGLATLAAAGSDVAAAYARQPDGKIVVAGLAPGTAGLFRMSVARFNANGTLDSTFGTNGRTVVTTEAHGELYAVVVMPDGKILAGGTSWLAQGGNTYRARAALLRLNPNGSVDATFGTNGVRITPGAAPVTLGDIRHLQVTASGQVLAVATAYGGQLADFAAVRYNADGSFDTSYGGNGTGYRLADVLGQSDLPTGAAMTGDGGLIAVGTSYDLPARTYRFSAVRFDANGIPDPRFDGDGRWSLAPADVGSGFAEVNAVAVDAAGRAVIAGRAYGGANGDALLLRLNATTAAVDPTFGGGGVARPWSGGNSTHTGVAALPDGRIAVTGIADGFLEVGGFVAVLRSDGTPDPGFAPGGIRPSGLTDGGDVGVLPGGQLVAVGYVHNAGSGEDFAAARFNTTSPRPPAPALAPASDTGASAGDRVTADNTPTFTATAPAGHYLRLFRNGVPTGGAYQPSGSVTAPPVADGTADWAVAVVDAAGNRSELSLPVSVTVDTARPVAGFVPVSPDPRDSAVASVTVTFTEPVAGLSLSHFTLTRDGGADLLAGSGATLTPVAGTNNYTLGGLACNVFTRPSLKTRR